MGVRMAGFDDGEGMRKEGGREGGKEGGKEGGLT